MRTKVGIITSGGSIPQLGTGHIARSLNLAHTLEAQFGIEVVFITSTPEILQKKNKKLRIVYYNEKANNPNTFLDKIEQEKIDIIIYDTYKISETLVNLISNLGLVSIALDISQKKLSKIMTFNVNSLIKKPFAELSGYSYLPLNKKLDMYSENHIKKVHIKKIFVSFGGFDANHVTYKFIKSVEQLQSSKFYDFKFNVVVGASFDKLNEIKKITANLHFIRIFVEPVNYYEMLCSSDAAITSGGITMFESIYLGLPTFVFSQYSHQKLNAKILSKQKAIIYMGSGRKRNLKRNFLRTFKLMLSLETINELRIKSRISIPMNGDLQLARTVLIFELLDWDSNFFKIRIARINSVVFNEEIYHFIQKRCRDLQIKVLYYISNKDDTASNLYAKSLGFDFIDYKLTYSRNLSHLLEQDHMREFTCTIASENDLGSLLKIVKDSFGQSRFFQDSRFDQSLSQKYYNDWIEKSITGQFDDLVLIVKRDNEIAGLVTCRINSRTLGNIGLICSSKKFRNTGVGAELLSSAVKWFNSQGILLVEIVTQGKNFNAQKLLEKEGFALKSVECWYHKWYENSSKKDLT